MRVGHFELGAAAGAAPVGAARDPIRRLAEVVPARFVSLASAR
jgi:hypothetical protein